MTRKCVRDTYRINLPYYTLSCQHGESNIVLINCEPDVGLFKRWWKGELFRYVASIY